MRKNYAPVYSLLVLIVLIFGIFYFMMPQSYDQTEAPLSEFSTKRALSIVKEISKKPLFEDNWQLLRDFWNQQNEVS